MRTRGPAVVAFALLLGATGCAGGDAEPIFRIFAAVAIAAAALAAMLVLVEIVLLVVALAALLRTRPSVRGLVVLTVLTLVECVAHGWLAVGATRLRDPMSSFSPIDRGIVEALVVPAVTLALVLGAVVSRRLSISRGARLTVGLVLSLLAATGTRIATGRLLEPWDDTPLALHGSLVDVAVSRTHTCVRTSAGELGCFGTNEGGALGGKRTVHRRDVPSAVPDIGDVRALAVDEGRTCALQRDRITCFGNSGPPALPSVVEAKGLRELGLYNRVLWYRDEDHLRFAGRVDGGMHVEDTLLPHDTVQTVVGSDFVCARSGEGQVSCMSSRVEDRLLLPVERATGLTATEDEACVLEGTGKVSCFRPTRVLLETYVARKRQADQCELVSKLLSLQAKVRTAPDPENLKQLESCKHPAAPAASPVVLEAEGAVAIAITSGRDVVCVAAATRLRCWLARMGPKTSTAWFDVGEGIRALSVRERGLCAIVASGVLRCSSLNDGSGFGAWLEGTGPLQLVTVPPGIR